MGLVKIEIHEETVKLRRYVFHTNEKARISCHVSHSRHQAVYETYESWKQEVELSEKHERKYFFLPFIN